MDAPHWALSSDGSGWMIYHPQPWMTQPFETKPLDATAKEWSPHTDGAPEEDRCLFMTFSNGHPVTEQEISRFFTLHYGDCVERVYVHWPQPKDSEENNITTPQFGKVVFKTSSIPLVMTLCGKRQIKFMLDGKTLWCKMFDPQKAQAFKRNGAS
ncbi:hypothetical protein Goshw_017583 [Gossypium schwendimanii]|uniref:RRM domain-containing protein n=3 Tax=Gossypium TaxID=3633 RepID=A0A7J9N198_GOSSC|nr:hypothetical protein [Gossypium lobatum]MBA0708761.1 hypothetical protein [Gossypium laxum]MBA0877081.1 hypothetical protein [Gossypium schwendimanii]